jgi:pSer/pThr/pTyr-binding forkhead associated (FHA) protein
LKANSFSAVAAGFSLMGFLRGNGAIVIVSLAAVAVVGVLLWLVLRRRRDAFPEIAFAEKKQAPENDVTQIESQPEKPLRSGPVPGIYGKIEVLVNGQQINTYLVTNNPLTIGRDPAQALAIIQESIVSKLHCSIFHRDGQVYVKDLNSTNGTYVNEEKVSERELHDADVIFLGRKGTIRIVFHK